MKYKLKDVIHEVEENVTFGTCDFCEYIGTLQYDTMVFEDENGNKYKVDNGYWEYGDYVYVYVIPNYIHFAEYVSSREFSKPKVSPSGMMLFEDVFANEIYNSYKNEYPEAINFEVTNE